MLPLDHKGDLLFRDTMGPDFLLMDDNARPHTAQMVAAFLEPQDTARMDWPIHSPDMNLIAHLWNTLVRPVASHRHPPSLARIYKLIHRQNNIDDLIQSMPCRCQDCRLLWPEMITCHIEQK